MPRVRLRVVSSTIRCSPCAQVYKASPRRCSMLSGFAPRPGRGAGRASTSRRPPDVPVLTCRTLAEAVVLRWFPLPGPPGRAVHPRSRQPKPPLYSCPTAFEGARLSSGRSPADASRSVQPGFSACRGRQRARSPSSTTAPRNHPRGHKSINSNRSQFHCKPEIGAYP